MSTRSQTRPLRIKVGNHTHSYVPLSLSMDEDKQARYKLVDGDLETTPGWANTKVLWRCQDPEHDPFEVTPRAMSRRRNDIEHCPQCRQNPTPDQLYPKAAKHVVKEGERGGPSVWQCPQCSQHFELTWRRMVGNSGTKVDSSSVIGNCPKCGKSLAARYPTLAAALLRTADGETDAWNVAVADASMTVIRDRNSVFVCPDCCKEEKKSLFAAIQTFKNTGRPPYCRVCHWKHIQGKV